MAETFTFDNLIAGSQKAIVQRAATVAVGQTWVRGQIVGKLTATGYWQIADVDAIGTYDDVGVAVEAIDTNEGGTGATTVYVEGEFVSGNLSYSYGDAAADWTETLAGHGIYLRDSVDTSGT